MNIGLREQSVLSNSADDLTQIVDQLQYPMDRFNHDYTDGDDGTKRETNTQKKKKISFYLEELHFDDGNTFDYETSIRDRLKKANEDLEHDDTPVELKHRQRVSFDQVVRAVDFGQDPQELENSNPPNVSVASPIAEEPVSNNTTQSQHENPAHQYTVPLNDIQPREGPSMLDKIKAVQFHGASPTSERWSTTSQPPTVPEGIINLEFERHLFILSSKDLLFLLRENERKRKIFSIFFFVFFSIIGLKKQTNTSVGKKINYYYMKIYDILKLFFMSNFLVETSSDF